MSQQDIAWGSAASHLDAVDDGHLLSRIRWRKSADRKLVAAVASADARRFCKALRRSLAQRRPGRGAESRRNSLPQLLQPLWSQYAWNEPSSSEPLGSLLVELCRRRSKRSAGAEPSRAASKQVLLGLQSVPPETSPWAQLVWLTILVEAPNLLTDRALLPLWRHSLSSVLSHPLGTSLASAEDDGDAADDRQLLTAGEVPWLAAFAFADLKGAATIQRRARSQLRRGLEAITDSDGTPHARTLHRLPLLLAVFTRSLSIAQAAGEKLFDAGSRRRFAQLVERVAIMAQPDGRLSLSNGASFAPASLLKTAAALSGLSPRKPAYRRLEQLTEQVSLERPPRRATKQPQLPNVRRRRTPKNGQAPSTQSDWAELACMRNNWSEGGDSCIIAHHAIHPQLSVTAFERLLVDGDWHLGVEVDGVPVELTAGWSCVCWFSDEDADYVELQQTAAEGVTLLRQVLLSRNDHLLFLADTAQRSGGPMAIDPSLKITSRLPLGDDVSADENRWTREVSLNCRKLSARLYPLGLDQERVRKAHGSLSVEGTQIVLTQSARSRGLHMPLVIDWSPDRQRSEAQWRQLTVAEDGRRLAADVACGQRLRVGKHQWLFYRSLQPGETGRTILGHHTPHETVIAEFTDSGEVEPIVLVDS